MGENTSLISYILMFTMAGLFFVSMYAFAVGFGNSYSRTEDFMFSDQFNLTATNTTLNVLIPNTASDTRDLTEADKNTQAGTENLILFFPLAAAFRVFGVVKDMGGVIINMLSLIGIPPIITGTIIALISIMLIFAIWRTYRAGE